MGNDEEQGFIQGGKSEEILVTLLGSIPSYHQLHRSKTTIPISTLENLGSQIEKDNRMVYKGVKTREREREPKMIKSSKDVDVRFFKSILSFRDRLKSSYFSCNQRQCPVIKERLDHHNQLRHSSDSPGPLENGPQQNGISCRSMTSSTVPKQYATNGTDTTVNTGTGFDTTGRLTSNNGRFEQHNTRALNINTGSFDDVQTTCEGGVTTATGPDMNGGHTLNNGRYEQQAFNENTGNYDDEQKTDKTDITTGTAPETNISHTSKNISFDKHNTEISNQNTGTNDDVQMTYKGDVTTKAGPKTKQRRALNIKTGKYDNDNVKRNSKNEVTTVTRPEMNRRHTSNNASFERHNTRAFNKNTGKYDDVQSTYKDDVTETRSDSNGRRNTINNVGFEQHNTGNIGGKRATYKHGKSRKYADGNATTNDYNNLRNVQHNKRNESNTSTTSLRNRVLKTNTINNSTNIDSNTNVKRNTTKANIKSKPFEFKNYVDAYSNVEYGNINDIQFNFDDSSKTSAKLQSINNDKYGPFPIDCKIDNTKSNTTLYLSTFNEKYNIYTKYDTKILNTFDRSSKSETTLTNTSKNRINSIAHLHKIQDMTKSTRNSKEGPSQQDVLERIQELPMFLRLEREPKEDQATITPKVIINSTTPEPYKFQEITEPKIECKEDLIEELNEWIQGSPMYSRSKKDDKTNTMNSLINSLNSLASEGGGTEYEAEAKKEINKCLIRLPIWYPGQQKDLNAFEDNKNNNNSKIIDGICGATNNRKLCNSTTIDKHKSEQHHTNFNRISRNSKVLYDEIKNTVMEWLNSVYLRKSRDSNGMTNNMPQIADFVIDRLGPLLSNPVRNKNRKLVLKNTILKILDELPISFKCSKNKNLCFFAEDLANNIFNIQAKYVELSNNTNISRALTYGHTGFEYAQNESILCCEIRKCFEDANINYTNKLMEEASLILMEFIEMPDPEGEIDARNEIIHLLVTFINLSETQASIIAKTLIIKVKNIIDVDKINMEPQRNKSQQRYAFSVYSSAEEFTSINYPLTSTPKKTPAKKTVTKFNPQEIQYMENVGNLIRLWIDTLPENFSAPEEQNFKDIIIQVLAGEITDIVKLEQLVPKDKERRKDRLYRIVYRWMQKINIMNDKEVKAQVLDLLNRLEDIPVPIMTQPQHGNRQEMENLKYIRDERTCCNRYFLPKGSDVLQDEISIWMNEQPSDIFVENDQISRNKKIQELAQVLENKLENRQRHIEILADVAQWLYNMVKPDEKGEIRKLSENLKARVINLPQDNTLIAKYDKKNKEFEEWQEERKNLKENPAINMNERSRTESVAQEHTMQIFISKYLEHNYDIDDPLARKAFNRLLVTYLQRLDQTMKKELYDNFEKSEFDDRFLPKKLISELEYIKVISDWLKNIPVEASFNTVGNLERIDLVNSLAISIREVEEERYDNPSAMDYDIYLASIIFEFVQELPIPKEYYKSENIGFMIYQLVNKITANRQTVINLIRANESLNTTGVNADNIGDFLEEFIKINGEDIAQDEAKLDAWTIRLIREVKRIIRDTECVIPKAQVYNELTGIPIPGDETANYFSLELEYVTEITNWIKNLPLLRINESEKEDRVRMICELAEAMIEMERKSVIDPNDTRSNIDFKEYVEKWISVLPLDKNHEIVLPVIIQQLMNRMERVKQKEVLPELDFTQSIKTIGSTPDKNRNQDLPKCQRKNVQNASNSIIDEIEKWSKALPIKTDSEQTAANIKNDISRNLLQKVGELNMNPKVFNNDLVYKGMLADEIDTILENMPQTANSHSKDKLKTDIVNAITDARNDIMEITAADTYKLNLENAIEASIPNPVNKKHVYDPGFEIYKDRLANMFILENFDHGTDIVKIKYEKLLKKEIDNYFYHAKNKNAVPISKDEIYGELYSALFKVSIPNEASIIEEIEEIKTRCEIDAWFEELPMQEASGLNELFEWDKVLSTLVKRIHEIEVSEIKSDAKILKEIMKCLAKLPLRSNYKNQLEKFAESLLKILKTTELQRKCVIDPKTSKLKKCKRCEKMEVKESDNKHIENSQVAGPSSNGKMWTSLLQPQQMPEPRSPRYKACDEIVEIVQNWCGQLPIKSTNPREDEHAQILKDNLATQIIIKTGELNMNPAIFNADSLYDDMLDEELENLLSTLPTYFSCENSKEARKQQLIEAIKSVKPLVIEERSNQRYKEVLNETVDKILKKRQNVSADREVSFNELRNDIIDDFIQYKYGTNDDEVRMGHKVNIKNTIIKFDNTVSNKDNENSKPLMKTNQLICELAKIPIVQCEANARDEVEEIRMKREVAIFFDELYLPDKDADKSKVNTMKAILAKKLNDIEMNGHNPDSENKMKQEVIKCLNKLEKEVDPPVVDAFINKLRDSEIVRRTIIRYEEGGGHVFEPQIGSRPYQDDDYTEDDLSGDSGVDEEEDDEEEEIDERECPIHRRLRRRRGIPYCMIPMRNRCIRCKGFNIFWCRIPFSES